MLCLEAFEDCGRFGVLYWKNRWRLSMILLVAPFFILLFVTVKRHVTANNLQDKEMAQLEAEYKDLTSSGEDSDTEKDGQIKRDDRSIAKEVNGVYDDPGYHKDTTTEWTRESTTMEEDRDWFGGATTDVKIDDRTTELNPEMTTTDNQMRLPEETTTQLQTDVPSEVTLDNEEIEKPRRKHRKKSRNHHRNYEELHKDEVKFARADKSNVYRSRKEALYNEAQEKNEIKLLPAADRNEYENQIKFRREDESQKKNEISEAASETDVYPAQNVRYRKKPFKNEKYLSTDTDINAYESEKAVRYEEKPQRKEEYFRRTSETEVENTYGEKQQSQQNFRQVSDINGYQHPRRKPGDYESSALRYEEKPQRKEKNFGRTSETEVENTYGEKQQNEQNFRQASDTDGYQHPRRKPGDYEFSETSRNMHDRNKEFIEKKKRLRKDKVKVVKLRQEPYKRKSRPVESDTLTEEPETALEDKTVNRKNERFSEGNRDTKWDPDS